MKNGREGSGEVIKAGSLQRLGVVGMVGEIQAFRVQIREKHVVHFYILS